MNFLKKYKLIIFLVTIVVILVIVKIYFGNTSETNRNVIQQKLITPTPMNLETLNEELFQNFYKLETEEEINNFLDKLTIEQRDYILDERSEEEYILEDLLPYETDDFIVEKYINEGVLLVKLKKENKEGVKNAATDWINENKETDEEYVIVWY